MNEEIHLVYGTDDNYISPTTVSVASAVRCFDSRESRLVIHLFDAGVTDGHFCKFVETIGRGGRDLSTQTGCGDIRWNARLARQLCDIFTHVHG